MKTKKSRKVNPAKTSGEKFYEAFSSKIGASKFAKKVEDVETLSHTAIVAQAMLKIDRPATLATIHDAVKKTGRFKTKIDSESRVRDHLALLVREGLAKITVVEREKAA